MNEKEAREIRAKRLGDPRTGIISPYDMEYYQSKGYLEAIEKTKVLVEVLRKMKNEYAGECLARHDKSKCHNCTTYKALAKWENEK